MRKLHYFWLAFSFLISACGSDTQDSSLDVVGGARVNVTTMDPTSLRFPFLVGISLNNKDSSVCTGFRYGVQTIVTSGSCLRKQLQGHGSFDLIDRDVSAHSKPSIAKSLSVNLSAIFGSGAAFQTTATAIFHNEFKNSCAESFKCPDIAILKLPDSLATTEHYIVATDPIAYDRFPGTDTDGSMLSIAGFGCMSETSDLTMSVKGSCPAGETIRFSVLNHSNTGFDNISYSALDDVRLSSIHESYQSQVGVPYKGKPYYLNVSGSNLGISSGDSGAPIFRLTDIPYRKDLRPGDTFNYTVDAMAVFTPSANSKTNSYFNVALDLGHPDVYSWLAIAASDDGQSISYAPWLNSGNPSKVCATDQLDPAVFGGPANDVDAYFDSISSPELKDQLKQIRSKIVAMNLASCFNFIETKREQLNEEFKNKRSDPVYLEKIAVYEYAQYLNVYMVETILEWQVESDAYEKALLEAERLAAEQEFKMIMDTVTDFVPGVSHVKDIYIIVEGKNPVTGEVVPEWERGVIAASILAPGALRGGANVASRLARGARTAGKLGKYGAKLGKLSAKLAVTGQKIKDAPAAMMEFFEKARSLGFKTADDLRAFARIGKKLGVACDVLDKMGRTSPGSSLHYLLMPFDVLVPTAYAADSSRECLRLAAEVAEYARKAGLTDAKVIEKYSDLVEKHKLQLKTLTEDQNKRLAELAKGQWTPHGGKHLKGRTEADAKRLSENGNPAQYSPDVNVQTIEELTILYGTHNTKHKGNTKHFYYKHDKVVGYANGEATQWHRGEISQGVFHGHPRDPKDVPNKIRKLYEK